MPVRLPEALLAVAPPTRAQPPAELRMVEGRRRATTHRQTIQPRQRLHRQARRRRRKRTEMPARVQLLTGSPSGRPALVSALQSTRMDRLDKQHRPVFAGGFRFSIVDGTVVGTSRYLSGDGFLRGAGQSRTRPCGGAPAWPRFFEGLPVRLRRFSRSELKWNCSSPIKHACGGAGMIATWGIDRAGQKAI